MKKYIVVEVEFAKITWDKSAKIRELKKITNDWKKELKKYGTYGNDKNFIACEIYGINEKGNINLIAKNY